MYSLQLGPALLLGLSSLTFVVALPTQDLHSANTTDSDLSSHLFGISHVLNTTETLESAGVSNPTPDNSCGSAEGGKNEGYTCNPNDLTGRACCSEYGNCGNGPLHCGKGCQPGFGKCDGIAVSKPASPHPSQTAEPHHLALRQSAPGQAEPNIPHCGPLSGNKRCPNNLCCSNYGFCGTTSEYCSVPLNCLPAFGRCDSDVIPGGINTSSDARPHVGQVSYDEGIDHCIRPRTIALTFDDGPSAHTSHLLDILAAYQAKATFFVVGNNIGKGAIDTTRQWFDLIQRMVAEGHQVASHTFDHARLSQAPSELRKIEMLKNERALANIIGKYPTYFRAPYSDCTTKSGCTADVKDFGYHLVHYNLDTHDYLHPNPDQIQESKNIVKEAFDKAPQNGNMLVLQHDTILQSTNTLTQYILQLIKAKGWEAVTVGTCMNDPIENWYREPSWIAPGTAPVGACVISRGEFCGTIPPFTDKISCFDSVGKCVKQVKECPTQGGSGVVEGCAKFENICRLQFAFCMICGGPDARPCESKDFQYKVE